MKTWRKSQESILYHFENVASIYRWVKWNMIYTNGVSLIIYYDQSCEITIKTNYDCLVIFYLTKTRYQYFIHDYNYQILILTHSQLLIPLSSRVALPQSDHLATPVCLTCDLSEDCQYVSASFSDSGKYYILSCLGPGVPQDFLRGTDNGLGKWSWILRGRNSLIFLLVYRTSGRPQKPLVL